MNKNKITNYVIELLKQNVTCKFVSTYGHLKD